MKDITSREDIKVLVDKFYDKVNQDKMLSPIFNEEAKVDWQSHLPIMYDFWSSILLGDMSYKGNPFSKHIPLPIVKQHFETWLKLFFSTIDENFRGSVANEAKNRAQSIAAMFQYKMGLLK